MADPERRRIDVDSRRVEGGLYSRREVLKRGVVGTAGLVGAGGLAARISDAAWAAPEAATVNWQTWADHYLPQELSYIKKTFGISVRPTLLSDDSLGYTKVKAVHGQFDLDSADALWVPKFLKSGLIDAFDIHSIPASKELYSVATHFPFWKSGSQYLAFPHAWSSENIYYNPKYVKPKPTSWDAILDPRYKKRIVMANQPTEVCAVCGHATGAKDPYNMTAAELSRAKEWMRKLKPNILKFAGQAAEQQRADIDESAWIDIDNLGTDVVVRAAGGPIMHAATPKEGVNGWVDGEMLVRGSPQRTAALAFLNNGFTARWTAMKFLANGHPYLNEKAYKLLVNQGHKERADRFFYNEPERVFKLTLAGPAGNPQAYIDAFNEVFGG
jgi:spermidine/putrescine-binding protein